MTVQQLIEQLEALDTPEEQVFVALRQFRSHLQLSPFEAEFIEDEEGERSGVYIEVDETGYAPRREG
jgi:hypothetical protein